MSRYTSRPYAGAADLRRMQDALSAAQGATWWHIGDLAWAVRDGAHLELSVWVKVRQDGDGDLAGWIWIRRQRSADVFLVPGLRDSHLLNDMRAEFQEVALRAAAAGDPVEQMSVDVAEDDHALREALAR